MKTILISILLILALIIPTAVSAAQEAQSCYAIMYTEVMHGDTWYSIATHWGMTTATLKAMNTDVPRKRGRPVPGSMLKVAVWIGCPSW